MKRLDELKWKAFFLTDVFVLKATKSSIDKCKLNGKYGSVPYITRTDTNNGWDGLVGEQLDYHKDIGNVITVGLDTQSVFYQPIPFYTGQNIQVLSSIKMNKYVASFIIPILKIQMKKFNWGGNGATLGRLKRLKIILPVDEKDEPNYAYMEAYMRNEERTLLEQYKEFIKTVRLQKEPEKVVFEGKRWKAFFMDEVFEIKSSVRLTKDNMVAGNRPFVGASDSNNGVTAFVSNVNNSLDSNVLGVNYNGSVVDNFYHPYEAIFSDDVKRLHFKNYKDDKYAYLFVKQAILQQKSKFEYGYKFNGERMKRQQILLPVTISGEPDYAFMSAYMKRIEYEMQSQYLTYLEK